MRLAGESRVRPKSAALDMAEFCRGEHPKLVGVLTLYTGDRDLAEELAQDVIVRVISNWTAVSRADSPGAWTHRVAINVANSWFRRALAGQRATAKLEARGTTPNQPANDADGLALRQAVAQLPQRQRTAIVLRYYADLPSSEVAAIMGCKDGTVWALVHQAIVALRRTPGFEAMEAPDV